VALVQVRPAQRLGLGLREGQKVPMESFWNVPLGPMQQIWPDLNESTYDSLVRDLFYKAQRANQDDLAVSAVGLALAKLLASGKLVRPLFLSQQAACASTYDPPVPPSHARAFHE
jgi:hypothetical protein